MLFSSSLQTDSQLQSPFTSIASLSHLRLSVFMSCMFMPL